MSDDYHSSFEPDAPDTRTNDGNPAQLSQDDVQNGRPDTSRTIPPLALDPDILGRFRSDLRLAGVAGEETLAALVYLAVTSRVLPWGKPTERPVSVIPKGTTSTGKSHTVRTTLRFFPASAYIDLGSMSRRFLFYSEESFEHRVVYVPEWASIKDDEEIVALLRVLLSEGRVVHGTVDIDRTARVIEKNGPTGLLMTTTEAVVDAEMETRCLTIVTDDSTEQTRRVYSVLADLEDEIASPLDFGAWHDLQEWIASRDTRAVVPFVRPLAELMPSNATRLRRDFATVLSLVRAHALLYQAKRETDARGRVVATVEGDYAAVRDLVGNLIAEGIEASVSATIRDTVDAVQALLNEGAAHVSPKALTEKLGVGRSATYDRIHRALLPGYLVDLAGTNERGMKLVVGAALPGSADFLPSPEEIVRHMSESPSGRSSGSTMHDPEELSGSPVRPDTPSDTDVDEEEIERLEERWRVWQAEGSEA